MQQLISHRTDLLWYLSIFRKCVQKIHVLLKSDKNNWYFTWTIYIFDHLSPILLRMRNGSDKSCRENQTTHYILSNTPLPPPEKRAVYEIVWKNIVEPGRPLMKYGACALHAGYLGLQTHTLRICNTFLLFHCNKSVRPSVCMQQLSSHWTDLLWYFSIFRKSVQKIHVSLKSDKNKGYFTWTLYIFYHLSLILLRMRNVSDKSCRENQTTH